MASDGRLGIRTAVTSPSLVRTSALGPADHTSAVLKNVLRPFVGIGRWYGMPDGVALEVGCSWRLAFIKGAAPRGIRVGVVLGCG